jgi:hypothetical protein
MAQRELKPHHQVGMRLAIALLCHDIDIGVLEDSDLPRSSFNTRNLVAALRGIGVVGISLVSFLYPESTPFHIGS